jgi:hypothetical protein
VRPGKTKENLTVQTLSLRSFLTDREAKNPREEKTETCKVEGTNNAGSTRNAAPLCGVNGLSQERLAEKGN